MTDIQILANIVLWSIWLGCLPGLGLAIWGVVKESR